MYFLSLSESLSKCKEDSYEAHLVTPNVVSTLNAKIPYSQRPIPSRPSTIMEHVPFQLKVPAMEFFKLFNHLFLKLLTC